MLAIVVDAVSLLYQYACGIVFAIAAAVLWQAIIIENDIQFPYKVLYSLPISWPSSISVYLKSALLSQASEMILQRCRQLDWPWPFARQSADRPPTAVTNANGGTVVRPSPVANTQLVRRVSTLKSEATPAPLGEPYADSGPSGSSQATDKWVQDTVRNNSIPLSSRVIRQDNRHSTPSTFTQQNLSLHQRAPVSDMLPSKPLRATDHASYLRRSSVDDIQSVSSISDGSHSSEGDLLYHRELEGHDHWQHKTKLGWRSRLAHKLVEPVARPALLKSEMLGRRAENGLIKVGKHVERGVSQLGDQLGIVAGVQAVDRLEFQMKKWCTFLGCLGALYMILLY